MEVPVVFKSLFNKMIGDRTERLIKRLAPLIDSVVEWADRYRELEDEDFPVKTQEFIYRIKKQECRIKEEFIGENVAKEAGDVEAGKIDTGTLETFEKKKTLLLERFISSHSRLIAAAAPPEKVSRFRSRKEEIRSALPATTYRLADPRDIVSERLSDLFNWEIERFKWRDAYLSIVKSAIGDDIDDPPADSLMIGYAGRLRYTSHDFIAATKLRKARSIDEILRLHDILVRPDRENEALRDFRKRKADIRAAHAESRGFPPDDPTASGDSLLQSIESEQDASTRSEWLERYYEALDRILPLLVDADASCMELERKYRGIMEELIPDICEVEAYRNASEKWHAGNRDAEFVASHCDLYVLESGLEGPLLPVLELHRDENGKRAWVERYRAGVRAFIDRAVEKAPVRERWEHQRKSLNEEDPFAETRLHEYFIDTNAWLIARSVSPETVREFLVHKNTVKREFLGEGDHVVRLFDMEQRNLVITYAGILDELLPDVMNLESDTKQNKRWKTRFNDVLDDLLPEAYGLVHEACRRLKEKGANWRVWDDTVTWDMVPFRVQIAGAIILHRGTIGEMATGEGKTLVATMPLYLNALTKKGAYLVTVNDYLARRDAEWMGGLYRFLGVTVGYLQQGMTFRERKEAYGCDITYGTNNEFGFDYLRDNMKLNTYLQVQRWRYFAIVDEVDSVLIDEARTPLIISDAVTKSRLAENYYLLRNDAKNLVQKQKNMINRLMTEAKRDTDTSDSLGLMDFISDGEETGRINDLRSIKLLIARKGDPKNRDLAELKQEEGFEKDILRWEERLMVRAKNNIPCSLYDLEELLYFVIDERGNTVKVTEKGRDNLSARVNSFKIPKVLVDAFTDEERKDLQTLFVMPNLSEKLELIDTDGELTAEEKITKKDELHQLYSDKNEAIQNFYQLLKAHVLFTKDVDYIVKDGSVIIVDEFTGRLMPGRRYSDGLHQALEAKENVGVERETQTVATITLQNYFKMFGKLSGMTGTAATEEEEFLKVYDIDVDVVPTNKPVRRIDYDDVIYRTKEEKRRAIVEEVVRLHRAGLPVLIGTVSVHESERLSNMLKSYRDGADGNGGSKKGGSKRATRATTGITHNVLNAKQHKSEAQIVAEAGQAGAVTIATNMAGRGTDIKLGTGVVKCERCCILCETPDECGLCPNSRKRTECERDVPCGLHVIGTERHESRRIDLQLRGRSGRQGDPGASRFFISLEDDLMRLIGLGSKRVLTVLDRLGAEKGQVIEHPMITRAISRAQKRMELFNFGIRKNLVEFDNVMNKQREAIYARRNEILHSDNPHEYVMGLIREVIGNAVDRHSGDDLNISEWELDETAAELGKIFRVSMIPRDAEIPADSRDRIIFEYLYQRAQERMNRAERQGVKRASELGEELRETAEQYFMQWALDRFEERKRKLPLELWFNKKAFSQISSIDLNLWAYRQKGQIPLSIIYDYEKFIMLKSIDDRWRDHLHEIDNLKEAIHLRSYAGKDVNVEFKKETYELFIDMIEEIDSRILTSIFDTITIDEGDAKKIEKIESMSTEHRELEAFHAPGIPERGAESVQRGERTPARSAKTKPVRAEEKIGRNDPCPCGSGKKYKKCCGRNAN